MTKLCIHEFVKDSLYFVNGIKYHIDLNPINNILYIYTPDGKYTDISLKLLNEKFI